MLFVLILKFEIKSRFPNSILFNLSNFREDQTVMTEKTPSNQVTCKA